MGENANAGGDLSPPLARKDASFRMIGPSPLLGSHFRGIASHPCPRNSKNNGGRGEGDKIGVEPKGERKAAIDREITGQGWPAPIPPSTES